MYWSFFLFVRSLFFSFTTTSFLFFMKKKLSKELTHLMLHQMTCVALLKKIKQTRVNKTVKRRPGSPNSKHKGEPPAQATRRGAQLC